MGTPATHQTQLDGRIGPGQAQCDKRRVAGVSSCVRLSSCCSLTRPRPALCRIHRCGPGPQHAAVEPTEGPTPVTPYYPARDGHPSMFIPEGDAAAVSGEPIASTYWWPDPWTARTKRLL